MTVNDTPLELELDTGAALSAVSEQKFKALGIENLEASEVGLTTITGEPIKVLLEGKVDVRYHGTLYNDMQLIVVESKGPALLGLDWLSKIRVVWKFIKSPKENEPADRWI